MNISFDFDRTEIDRFFFYWKNLGISEKKKKKKHGRSHGHSIYHSLNRDNDHSWVRVHGEGINREWSRALYYDRRN